MSGRSRRWQWWAVLVAAVALAGPADDAVQAGIREYKAERWESAVKQFGVALAADPAHLPGYFWRARCLQRLGRWADAATDLEVVVGRKPESAASWVELARCYMELKRTAEASAALGKALALETGNPQAKALREQLTTGAPEPATPSPAPPVLPTRPPEPAAKPVDGRRPVFGQPVGVGSRVAVATDGVTIKEESVAVDGQRLFDYTFGAAPTDWVPGGGIWQVTNRYACEPDWSFFGGQSYGLCAIWNKRRFAGDMVVEAYVAFKHGLPWADKQWFYQPSDLNINLCSELGNLGSGYSFIYSGSNASTTMIRRGDKVLVASREEKDLLPQFTDQNPLFVPDTEGREFGTFHRHWWRLECRRVGQQLSLWVDGRKLVEAADPDPVPSGHLALWTMNSGMMVARVRVAYGQELRLARPQVIVQQPAPLE